MSDGHLKGPVDAEDDARTTSSEDLWLRVVGVESALVRWEDGLALFRVRLRRADGAIAEAHGAAHDGEAEQFWLIAEDRARHRAAAVMETLALIHTGAGHPAVPEAGLIQPGGQPVSFAGTLAPGAGGRQTIARQEAGRENGSPVLSDGNPVSISTSRAEDDVITAPGDVITAPGPAHETELTGAGLRVEPLAGDGSAVSGSLSTSTGPAAPGDREGDPARDDDLPRVAARADDLSPTSAAPADASAALARRPGHIRGEPGGAAAPAVSPAPDSPGPAPQVSTPASLATTDAFADRSPRTSVTRTQPIPRPVRCSHPGCNLPLTGAQVTLSTQKHLPPLCARHIREHMSG